VFSATALQMLASKVAAVSGDVRRALDLGRRVIEISGNPFRGKPQPVPSHLVLKTTENQSELMMTVQKQIVPIKQSPLAKHKSRIIRLICVLIWFSCTVARQNGSFREITEQVPASGTSFT